VVAVDGVRVDECATNVLASSRGAWKKTEIQSLFRYQKNPGLVFLPLLFLLPPPCLFFCFRLAFLFHGGREHCHARGQQAQRSNADDRTVFPCSSRMVSGHASFFRTCVSRLRRLYVGRFETQLKGSHRVCSSKCVQRVAFLTVISLLLPTPTLYF
jgi:hypothetical protein